MQWRILTFVPFMIAGLGCNVGPVEVAPAGAAPPVRIPVGPIPGPAKQVILVANPFSSDPIALAQGRKLFTRFNCEGCHGGRGGGGMGPSLRDVTWIYGDSDAHIFDSIAEGRARGMPAWGTKVPEQEIWKIVAYIKSMRTPLEPNPPRLTIPEMQTRKAGS